MIKPVMIELSVISKTLFLKYKIIDSAQRLEKTAVAIAIRNKTSLSLKERISAKHAKKIINWDFTDLKLIS
jgi:hypothetical protein